MYRYLKLHFIITIFAMQVYSAKEIIKLLSNTSCFASKLNQELNRFI